jgi:hypothetical protein
MQSSPTLTLGKDLLWSLLPHPSPEHVVRTYWRRPDGTRGGDYARTQKELDRFIEVCFKTGRNGYLAPNPTKCKTGDRHETLDVTHWSWFLIDVDPVQEECDPLATLNEALLWLGEWAGKDLTRSRPTIIDSGRGMQAWIRLDDQILTSHYGVLREEMVDAIIEGRGNVDRKTARKTMSHWLKRLDERIGLMNGCKIDTSCSDLPRLMRCPGTTNQKTGRTASILYPGDGPVAGLAQLLVTGTPASAFAEAKYEGDVGRTWQAAFGDLTRAAQDYLTKGKEEPGRHVTVWKTLKSLAEKGVYEGEARKAIAYANKLAGEDNELEDSALETIVRQVFST